MSLEKFFIQYPKDSIAFSVGVDSAYLLYAAKQYAKEVQAYYVKSEFQPQFELDDADDRPGMKALHELSVLSPLRICGLTKEEIRRLSKDAGLFTWDKPAYTCLATRISTGEIITEEKLKTTTILHFYRS